MMLKWYSMSFDGHLLARGFWLYVWEIKSPVSQHVYVGRTGDAASPYAQSPFKRIGQHLDPRENAKGNALGKQLRRAGVASESCTFEMVAIGPIFPEQQSWAEHVPKRDKVAALERAVADLLSQRGYKVLGSHPSQRRPDSGLLRQVRAILDPRFPRVASNEALHRTRQKAARR